MGLLLGTIAYELKTGKLLNRGWKVYARRDDNPMLYWASVMLQVIVALIFAGIWLLAIFGSERPNGS